MHAPARTLGIHRKASAPSLGECPTTCLLLRWRNASRAARPLRHGCGPSSSTTSLARNSCSAPIARCGHSSRPTACHRWCSGDLRGQGRPRFARLVAGATQKAFEPMSAVTAGVKDVREVVERARARLGERGQGTILFLDEVHRFNRTQQDALLPHVEDGLLVLVSATTENPFFSLTGPLLSRSTLFRLEPLTPASLEELLARDHRSARPRRRRADPRPRSVCAHRRTQRR